MDDDTRICSHCEKEITQGWMEDEGWVYACSKDCGRKIWGKDFDLWMTEEPTEEQRELMEESTEIFWTTWADYEIIEED